MQNRDIPLQFTKTTLMKNNKKNCKNAFVKLFFPQITIQQSEIRMGIMNNI